MEHAVSTLMLHNSQGPLTAEQYNQTIAEQAASRGETFLRPVTQAELDAMTTRLNELHYRWRMLKPGESIDFSFEEIESLSHWAIEPIGASGFSMTQRPDDSMAQSLES